MKKAHSIHFVGIKGVGLTPLAIIAKEAGIIVTGSDVEEVFITDNALEVAGIQPFVGFDASHVPHEVDLVITTGAHGGYSNPEVIEAKKRGIPVWSKGQAVGEFMKGDVLGRSFEGIAVAGSHGKTTTTAMLTTIFRENRLDPTYIIGTGSVGQYPPGHLGKGKYFIAESDEYATEPMQDHTAQFLWQRPKYILFTNIEHDHPDIYPTLDDVETVFKKFAHQIQPMGVLVGNGDDARIYSLLQSVSCPTISYGFSPKNTYVITRLYISGNQTFFHIQSQGMDMGEIKLNVAGEHNAMNALGAMLVAIEAGVSFDQAKSSLLSFTGSKRRLEYKGQLKTGALIFDDYAHHPTEIKSTLKTLKAQFPDCSLLAVFQPHTFSRTKALLSEFSNAFEDADQVILMPIFASAREGNDPDISSEIFLQKLSDRHPAVRYLSSQNRVADFIMSHHLKENTVIVFMGAGDIYKTISLLDIEKPEK